MEKPKNGYFIYHKKIYTAKNKEMNSNIVEE